jgi:pSer/pThr/pTyr-binding forkhead associated (FHA) protein
VIELRVQEGSESRIVRCDERELTIGRTATVALSDPRVSRAHAAVEKLGDVWTLRDLGSSNGTHFRGMRISGTVILRDGDVFQIGDTIITVHLQEPPSAEVKTITDGQLPLPRFTRRETDILQHLCQPLMGIPPEAVPGPTEIGTILHITPDAVKKYLRRLAHQLGVPQGRGMREAIAREAIRRGFAVGDAP